MTDGYQSAIAELARALATGPKVLLLDEIGGGLTDAEANGPIALLPIARGRGNEDILEHVHPDEGLRDLVRSSNAKTAALGGIQRGNVGATENYRPGRRAIGTS